MNPALRFLRRRTVWRALHSYRVWIGKAVGWWSILYLVFWLVIFALSGAEMIVRLEEPLPRALVGYLALAVSAAFLALLLSGRAPPVVLDRRDLYRLGLAPTVPWHALRYRVDLRRWLVAVAAAVVGGLWSLLAPPYLHLSAPWASPALALLAVVYADVAWLRYAGYRRRDPVGAAARRDAAALSLAVAVTLALPALLSRFGPGPGLDAALPAYSPLAAMARPTPVVLLVPLLLALLSHLAVRRSLALEWPPRFAAQSLVLTQLQAMRAFQLLAGLAGAAGNRVSDAGERKRLLDALHDRPGVTRPRRSLKPPPLGAPPWRALAWRSSSLLYRRPLWAQLRSALLTAAAIGSLFAAAQVVAGARLLGARGSVDMASDALAGGGALGASFAGAIGVLLAAFVMARAGAALLGPGTLGPAAPLRAGDRTLGRLAPALSVIAGGSLLVVPAYLVVMTRLLGARTAIGAAEAGAARDLTPTALSLTVLGLVVLAFAVLTLTCLAALEKYSSWSGAAASRWEPQVVAALLVALPVIVLVALDVASWILPAQLALLTVVWFVEV